MSQEPIAIVGSACRFAGDVDTPSKLWELLEAPHDLRQEIPKERFSANGFYHPNHAYHGHTNVRHSYLLSQDPAAFDAEFFGINVMEAKSMDPQQRLTLETVYEAIEAAGMTIEGMSGSDTCVYAGVMTGDYEAMVARDVDQYPTYTAVGTSRAVLSNRISYFFNWKGASVTMDTACSSSMVALHSAIQTLRSGDSETAVVCGANLLLGPECYIIESTVKMLSPDGYSRMWDKDANGYARGDGIAAIVIKPLSVALRDRDHIECIVRETGLNQDGTTGGLTMPNPSSQRDLILRTYARAGLDLGTRKDRPQYFEAHGTGTPAGDPVEAEAISTAFFPSDDANAHLADGGPLYVGSIKTVLGHTEGTAGLAAVLKAMLAIQHSCIPANLHFNKLSPSVEPFYNNLEILRRSTPWPRLTAGEVRRASVNSFGFGGTNAHAIIESYEQPISNPSAHTDAIQTVLCPFVFSAASEKALRGNVAAYIDYLDSNENCDAHDLAYTLRERRSVLQYRLAVPAPSCTTLREMLATFLSGQQDGIKMVRTQPKLGRTSSKILGVFTGQGAQYAAMGAHIIHNSIFARDVIRKLQSYLMELPEQDQPSWSMEKELLADSDNSRVSDSSISQPLNTAIQIMLVDLLGLANVHFDVVVGHSSGEIAAAYAAGFLSARDGMCISYYRGICCQYAQSPNGGTGGSMLAAGTSMADALELIRDETFRDRISLAAVNSPSSVTISGDTDAIEELALVMEDEGKFYRKLHVDKAYHSQHMKACIEPYATGMKRAGICSGSPRPPTPGRACQWYSSVYNGKLVDESFDLSSSYWIENLVNPVMFESALSAALKAQCIPFDAVLEIGPHPALQGPSTHIMQDILKKPVPYHGTLNRNIDSLTAISTTLGFLWSELGRVGVELGRFERLSVGKKDATFRLLKDLPRYQWNHDTSYWSESRRSRHMRTRSQAVHPLLGHLTPESGPHAMRWKHVLKPSEMPWLVGHAVQNQVVFPAAGYICTAIEASRFLPINDESIQIMELDDFIIHQAVPFQSEDDGIEILVELSQILRSGDGITTRFSYSAALGGPTGSTDFSLVATATIHVQLGECSPHLLPERLSEPPHMIDVKSQRLYDQLAKLEYNFSGPFCSLVKLRRKLGFSRCIGQKADRLPDCSDLLVHPADLDAAFQAVNLAFSYPGDEQLRYLHLPTRISSIRINPAALQNTESHFNVDATWNQPDPLVPTSGFSGNARLYFGDAELQSAGIQVDDVVLKPIGDANEERKIFHRLEYVPTRLDGEAAAEQTACSEYERELMHLVDRMGNFYAVQFDRDVPSDSRVRVEEGVLKHYLHFCHHLSEELVNGGNKFSRPEWIDDTEKDVMDAIDRLGPQAAKTADVQLMLLVGKTMPRVFRGEADMLEEMRLSGLLDEFYRNGAGLRQATLWLTAIIKQLTDRSPHLRFLEVGAGTGSATKDIFETIKGDFDHYTFTDISASFFDDAKEHFAPWKDRMSFKTCNVELDPTGQDFTEGEYDVIIASQILHATSNLSESVRNLRRLLKPGGWLLIGECSSNGKLHCAGSVIFGILPGWWNGIGEGRVFSPFASTSQWHDVLRQNGFGGIETMNPPHSVDEFGVIAMAAQAVDERIAIMRTPLSSPANLDVNEVLIIGGKTEPVATVVDTLQQILGDLGARSFVYRTLEDMDDRIDCSGAAVISLTDVEQPVFQNMDPSRWQKFRKLFIGDKEVLWLTCGRLKSGFYNNMTVGFGRVALSEEAELRLQNIDIDNISQLNARMIAEAFVRFTNKKLKDGSSKDILHTVERELIIDERGCEMVPRLAHLHLLNDRLRSSRRIVTHQTDLQHQEVALETNPSGCFLRQLTRFDKAQNIYGTRHELVELRTRCSTLTAIRTPSGYQWLVLGTDPDGVRYLALTSSVTSVLRIPLDTTIKVCQDTPEDTQLVLVTANQLIAFEILGTICSEQRIIVHNASAGLAKSILGEARQRGVHVTFTTTCKKTAASSASAWILLQQYAGVSEILSSLDPDAMCLVDFSREPNTLSKTLATLVSQHCRKEDFHTLYSPRAVHSRCLESPGGSLRDILSRALHNSSALTLAPTSGGSIRLHELVATDRQKLDPGTVVDWTDMASVPARVSRCDVVPMFKSDHTYWLCGLSGALGVSVCDWMVDRGVRNMVISSRNPQMDQRWIENHQLNGATIKIVSCDVTDEAALRKVHQEILQTLPPIAGVVSAAMVLRDVSIRNMRYDQLQDVIRPKVLGSIHLDRIFHDVNLDFFIVLSSTNAITGNPGQANYAAANMGMAGVAAHRRQRGLRASVAHVGAVIGAGYVTDSIDRLELTVSMTNLIRVSEQDVHQNIAEAFEAGFDDSNSCAELIMGIKEVPPQDPGQSKWFNDPKFSRLLLRSSAGVSNRARGESEESVRERLESCKTFQEVHQVLKQAFTAQMRKILFIKHSDEEIMDSASTALGLDSLIAVDIRSWISKTFNVSIPVLQIMSADTRISDLVNTTMDSLPAQMTPNCSPGEAASQEEDSATEIDDCSPTTNITIPDDAIPTQDDGDTPAFDWYKEALAPKDIGKRLEAAAPRATPEVILLTGASGLLGHHLLSAFCKQASVRKVICIAVRRLSERLASGELPSPADTHNRVEYHEGDLALPRFGLPASEEARIFDEVDAVVHNGADTSHMKHYSAVRGVNVESTKQLVRLCVPRRVPLHYVSSAGMALASGLDPFPSVAAARSADILSRDWARGYICSKWVCERLLENANAEYGLPVWIQRPSTIIREGEDAVTERAGFDWVNTLMEYSHKIGGVPRIENNTGAFDLVRVQTCCDDIVSGVMTNKPRLSNGMTYQNNVGDVVIPMAQLKDIALRAGHSEPYAMMSWEEWTSKAIAAGLHPAVAALVEIVDRPGGPAYPSLSREIDEATYV